MASPRAQNDGLDAAAAPEVSLPKPVIREAAVECPIRDGITIPNVVVILCSRARPRSAQSLGIRIAHLASHWA